MKLGGGKQKGSAFERLVSTQLSLWVSCGKRDDLFWRSAMSGGRATLKFKKGLDNKTQQGDISAITPEGAVLLEAITVECKNYTDLRILSMLFLVPLKNSLLDFWKVHTAECSTTKKIPFLVAKQNRTPFTLLLTIVDLSKYIEPVCIFPKRKCYVYNFEAFLKLVKTKDFLKLIKTNK